LIQPDNQSLFKPEFFSAVIAFVFYLVFIIGKDLGHQECPQQSDPEKRCRQYCDKSVTFLFKFDPDILRTALRAGHRIVQFFSAIVTSAILIGSHFPAGCTFSDSHQ